jgi:hypothetical protein
VPVSIVKVLASGLITYGCGVVGVVPVSLTTMISVNVGVPDKPWLTVTVAAFAGMVAPPRF